MCYHIGFAATRIFGIALGIISLCFIIPTTGCSSSLASLKSGAVSSEAQLQILTVISSEPTSTYGMAVTFTASVPSGLTGEVTFLDSGTAIGSAVLQQNSATLTTSLLSAGTHTITAAWPGNVSMGSMTSPSIVQIVKQAVPMLAWLAPVPITYGTALSALQLNATSSAQGTFSYSPVAGTILTPGTYTLSVNFTPTDMLDYTTATQTAQLTVNKATPAISWPTPESIDYGIPLSEVQLDASASVAGQFAYSPSLGTILGPGQNTVTTKFTPADPADYNSATASITQMVIQPTITVSVPASSVLEGSSLVFTAAVAGIINETVQWEVNGIPGGSTQIGTISPAGVYTAPNQSNLTVRIGAVLQADPAIQGSETVQIIGPQSSPGTIGFAFSLPTAAATSAGVYDSSGALVRTLWSNKSYPAGVEAASWDGNDDYGNPAPAGSYQLRVLYNNVQYSWGVIGDTSASWTAKNSWDQQGLLPTDMAIIGNRAYTANGYAEGTPNASSFDLATPQQPEALFIAGQCNQSQFVTTDGTLLYFANIGDGWSGSVPYVFAFNPATQNYYTFAAGTNYRSACGSSEPTSVIDLGAGAPTGIAVQLQGNLLAVAHGASGGAPSQDIIKLFDKTSGAPVGVIRIANPQSLAFAPDGNLWAISGNSVVLISGVGASNTVVLQLPGLVAPQAVAVDPSTSNVLVSDGGTAQQVKRFSETGELLSTYGDPGGYTDCDPTVTDSRLFLDTTAGPGIGFSGAEGGGGAFLAVLPDGSYWVGDPGNARVLHISAQGNYIEQIAFLRYLYHVVADHGNPSRVFADDLEYHIDYTQPLLPGDPDPTLGGNGSWSLVRNWAACSPSTLAPWFIQVQTLANGSTYALIPNLSVISPVSGAAEPELAELPVSGPVRLSGEFLEASPGFPESISHQGGLAYWLYQSAPNNELTQSGYSRPLTGYDFNGWPVWGSPTLLATLPATPSSDPLQSNEPIGFGGWGMTFWPEPTSGNILPTYNTIPAPSEPSYHLGGVPIGGTTWVWKASPGGQITAPDGKGTFPDINSFGGHNGIAALVEGPYIIEGYDGQYGSFSSQWMLWSQDGLLIGQFGHPANGLAPDGTKWPGAAGNIASMSTISMNGNIYLYNSDESYHAGIHQWKISGLDTIHELQGSASIGGTTILK